jgi:hypothetical protein
MNDRFASTLIFSRFFAWLLFRRQRAGASNPLFSPAAGTLPYAIRADRECQLVTEIEQQVEQIKSDLDEILREAKKTARQAKLGYHHSPKQARRARRSSRAAKSGGA